MNNAEIPQVEVSPDGREDVTTFTHPAFGVVFASVITGGATTLFGSDVPHNSRIRIEIKNARMDRQLSRDWVHQDRQPIVVFEMSHHQFAQFVTSIGRGDGVPITLRTKPEEGSRLQHLPSILKHETAQETFKNEIKESAVKKLKDMNTQVAKLADLIEGGRVTKSALREIHRSLALSVQQLPGSLNFVVESAEEALEKATVTAKLEVEAFIDSAARNLGYETIDQFALSLQEEKK